VNLSIEPAVDVTWAEMKRGERVKRGG